MNFRALESKQKLGGVYYTPTDIADFIGRWVCSNAPLTLLEPSCGEGSFIEAVATKCQVENVALTICDIDFDALHVSLNKAIDTGFTDVRHVEGDFVAWSMGELLSSSTKRYDAILGNPPFIRYQYLDKAQQDSAQDLYAVLGKKFSKHTNIWVAFLMAALNLLNDKGRLAFVIPEEITNVLYASELREHFAKICSKTVLVSPKNRRFEGTLQGTVVLLAEKKASLDKKPGKVGIYEATGSNEELWARDPELVFNEAMCRVDSESAHKWTKLLLSEEEYQAYKRLVACKAVKRFDSLAKAEVGIVTGANSFFLVNNEVVKEYGLENVIRPMFGRSSHCPGIIYDAKQHKANAKKGYPTNFVMLNGDDVKDTYGNYLALAHEKGIPDRYKCRIRETWYQVPSLYTTNVAMMKRSSNCPRLIFNEIEAYTTDTAYRVRVFEDIQPRALVCSFLNSLTALSAELEGRFYGGGVLELVPSEVKNLVVPYLESEFVSLDELDKEIKTLPTEEVLERQDGRLCEALGLSREDMSTIRNAWKRLSKRRQS